MPENKLTNSNLVNFMSAERAILAAEIDDRARCVETAKLINLAGTVAGAFMITNPFGLCLTGVSAGLYFLSVFADLGQTGKLYLLPCARVSTSDAANRYAAKNGQEEFEPDTIDDGQSYLSPVERRRWDLLTRQSAAVYTFLSAVPNDYWTLALDYLVNAEGSVSINDAKRFGTEPTPKVALPAVEVAKPIDLNAYAKQLYSGLHQAQKAEVKALQETHGRNAALEHMVGLYGLTDAQIEAEAPGLLAKLRPDMVQQLPALKSAENPSIMDRLMEEPFQSLAVLGGQRSGKTYLMSVMTALIKAKIGTKIIYVNLYDPNGDAHTDWEHADICITGHLMKMDEYNGRNLIEKTTQVMQQFLHDSNAIVVFDEWVRFAHISNGWSKKVSQEIQQAKIMSTPGDYIEPEGIGHSAVALLNMVCAVAGDLATIGKKQLKAIHLLSPDFVAGNVEQQGKAMKALRPLVVGISLGRAVSWTHPKLPISQNITFDAAGYDNSAPNFAIPPLNQIPLIDSDRMAFINGGWYGLDNLPAKPVITKPMVAASEPLASPWDDTEPADAPINPPTVNDTIAKLESAGISIKDLQSLFSEFK